MCHDRIQAYWEDLDCIAASFGKQAEICRQMFVHLQKRERVLQDGGWEGQGSDAFCCDMELNVLPAVGRLVEALGKAQATTLQIKTVLRQAEVEAALLFRIGCTDLLPAKPTGDLPGKENEPGKGLSPVRRPGTGPSKSHAPVVRPPQVYDDEALRNGPPLVLGPGATHQDLAAVLEQMYRENDHRLIDGKYGVDHPIRIVQVGDNDYAVFISGTDAGGDGHNGGNDWASAILDTGRGLPSPYQLQIQQLISETVPAGSTIHLVGHSQGAHVAMGIAGYQSFVDQYKIGSVNTYGMSGNVPYNPRVGADRYHNYIMDGDLVARAAERPSEYIPFTQIQNPLHLLLPNPLGIPGVAGSPSVDPIRLADNLPHGGYYHSASLSAIPVPFEIDRWEPVGVGSYQATVFSNARIGSMGIIAGWEDVREGWVGRRNGWGIHNAAQIAGGVGQMGIGVADIGWHAAGTTAIAYHQTRTSAFTQYMPEWVQVGVDRGYDYLGTQFATSTTLTKWTPAYWSWMWER